MVVDTCPATAIAFQGKDKREHFEFYFRQHWIRLLGPLCKNVFWNALIFGIGYLMFVSVGIDNDLTRRSLLAILCGGFLLTNVEFLLRFYKYFLYTIIVTDKKVHRVKKTLLCCNDHQSIDLWMLQDIGKCQHGLVQNVFGFGSITLEAQETVLRLHFIPRVDQKYIQLLHLQERARGGGVRSQRKEQQIQDAVTSAKEAWLDMQNFGTASKAVY